MPLSPIATVAGSGRPAEPSARAATAPAHPAIARHDLGVQLRKFRGDQSLLVERGSRISAAKPRSAPARRARDEQLAAEYLERAGFRVLDRNYRSAEGEIDIVAADHRTLVACQVTTRSSLRHGTPADARKLRRLRRLALNWVLTYGVTFDEVRVDVVGVLESPDGEFTIEHAHGVG